MEQEQVRVVLFQDGGVWIAQCVEYDICAQATDLETVIDRFDAVIKADFAESMQRTGKAFGGIGPAPEYVGKMMQGAGTYTSPRPFVRDTSPHYEMALCA